MPTMLVEIADSRCPPASGVLLATGCASTSTTPDPAGFGGPGRSVVPGSGVWGWATPRARSSIIASAQDLVRPSASEVTHGQIEHGARAVGFGPVADSLKPP